MAEIPGITPSGPTEVLITNTNGIKINQLQAKYQSKEQFVATLASQFYLYAKIDDTNDAIENANKAFRNAIIFWNIMCKDYGSAIVDNSDLSKIKL